MSATTSYCIASCSFKVKIYIQTWNQCSRSPRITNCSPNSRPGFIVYRRHHINNSRIIETVQSSFVGSRGRFNASLKCHASCVTASYLFIGAFLMDCIVPAKIIRTYAWHLDCHTFLLLALWQQSVFRIMTSVCRGRLTVHVPSNCQIACLKRSPEALDTCSDRNFPYAGTLLGQSARC